MSLKDSEVASRVKIGRSFCSKFARNARQAALKFRDSSNPSIWFTSDEDDFQGGDVPFDVPQCSNVLTTNLLVKQASIAINDPDFYVTSNGDNDSAHIARDFLRLKWRLSNWVRLSQKIVLDRYVTGLGITAYLFDDENGTSFERVKAWDFAVSPSVTDWDDVKWCARRIKMTLRDAIDRYGKDKFNEVGDGKDAELDKLKIEIWLYYDNESECHIYDDEVIERDKNQYGKVPFLFLVGDDDPGPSIWPLSDFVLAGGMAAELADINMLISNSAKHGGPINLVNIDKLGKGGQEALENGRQQGYIPVRDTVEPPVMRIPGEPLSGTVLEAKREMQNAIDGIMGSGEYERGVIESNPKFATQTALLANRSGARAVQSRIDFERFLTKMARIVILMEIAFGGPREGHESPEEEFVWTALQDVNLTELHVIESSTTYKDPSFELQQAMQIINVLAPLTPLFQQAGKMPNFVELANDIFRASGRHEVERYWIDAPPPPPQPGMMPPPGAGPGQAPGQPQIPQNPNLQGYR